MKLAFTVANGVSEKDVKRWNTVAVKLAAAPLMAALVQRGGTAQVGTFLRGKIVAKGLVKLVFTFAHGAIT